MTRCTALLALALAAVAACASPPPRPPLAVPTPRSTPAATDAATPSPARERVALVVQRSDLSIAVLGEGDAGGSLPLPSGVWYAAAANAAGLLLLLDADPEGRRVALVALGGGEVMPQGEWRLPQSGPANGCVSGGGRIAVGDVDSAYWLLAGNGAVMPLDLGRGHSDACAWLDDERLVVKSATGDRLTLWRGGRAEPIAVRAESPSVAGGRLVGIDRAGATALVVYDIGPAAAGAAESPLTEVARTGLTSPDEQFLEPRLAPDGRSVLVTIYRQEDARLARFALEGDALELVRQDPRTDDLRWYALIETAP